MFQESTLPIMTTPSAPAWDASRLFITGAATPPVPGGEHPSPANSFTPSMTADNTATCEIAGGHRPPLQFPFHRRRGGPIELALDAARTIRQSPRVYRIIHGFSHCGGTIRAPAW